MARIRHLINFCINDGLVDLFSLEGFNLFIERCPVQEFMDSITTDAGIVALEVYLHVQLNL